jgi:prepilin-type N-terminal cleavage/methylation domain-containing protein
MINKGSKRNGFTFVEMLLAVSLVGLISLALYQSLSNGLRIWKHAQKFVVEEDIGIFLEKISHDLRNTFKYSLISFDGREKRIAFPTIVRTLQDKKRASGRTNYIDQIGKVEYSFDKAHKTISRRQANYGQAMEEEYGAERLLAKPVHSLRFLYYYIEDGEYKEKRQATELMPVAVRVEIEFFEDTGKKRTVERVVPIPVNL